MSDITAALPLSHPQPMIHQRLDQQATNRKASNESENFIFLLVRPRDGEWLAGLLSLECEETSYKYYSTSKEKGLTIVLFLKHAMQISLPPCNDTELSAHPIQRRSVGPKGLSGNECRNDTRQWGSNWFAAVEGKKIKAKIN
jgi:hypothetical protein